LGLDARGNIAEGAGCNAFFMAKGVVYWSAREFVLAGVSRQVVRELCADEAFFTSTSLCICLLASLDGAQYPAPVTVRLMRGFSDLEQYDFAAQYLRFLSVRPASIAL
jgi:branched-chain amino acid aminotransferase